MNLTDREMLEMAAKAAGIEIVGPVEKFIVQPNEEHIGGFVVRNNRGGDSAWNPLTDDGDALRLAVKLGLEVCAQDGEAFVTSPDENQVREYVCNDQYEATRRAIVRAAAKIGKDMP